MKKLFLFMIYSFTNISYASFPVFADTIVTIDDIVQDTTKLVNKETTEQYHLRMKKRI